ncbi:EIF4B (predicted) [Pycnogonum litorale]
MFRSMEHVNAKSKKNKKGKTVKLNQFLAEGNGAPAPGYALANVHNSWADEVESNEFVDSYASYASSGNRKIYLPTAPKSARDPDVDMSKLPSEPPFKAFLANVPYDVDEKDIEDFFSNLKVRYFVLNMNFLLSFLSLLVM